MTLDKIHARKFSTHSFVFALLVLLVGLCYYVYTGQMQFAVIIWLLYTTLYFLLRWWSSNSRVVIKLFSLFFVIYTGLVLETQIELIHDPYENFYVHNDAAWSFYTSIMDYVLPCNWEDLPEKTLYHPFFLHYPLSAFVMGGVGKFGQDIGVENLRLLIRLISPVCGVLIISLMANILRKNGLDNKRIFKLLLPFGLFSYLYITSAIGTRDIHVCLIYTLAMYVCLCQNLRGRFFYFVVLFLLSYGCRPENGYLYLIYPITYYYKRYRNKIGAFIYIILAFFIAISFVYLSEYISSAQETFSYYDDRAQSMSSTGGLFLLFYRLPFPLDKIAMIVYTMMAPQPATAFLFAEGYSIMNMPFLLSPYLMFFFLFVTIRYVIRSRKRVTDVHIFILMSFLVFIATIYGDPHLRRAFAAIPGLYMCYCLVEAKCPRSFKTRVKLLVWPAIAIVSLFLVVYTWGRF